MAHRPAALKSVRKDAARRLRNKNVKSRLHTEQVKLSRMLDRGELPAAEAQLGLLTKLYQRAAARKVVKANTASRRQAQFQRRVNALRAAGAK